MPTARFNTQFPGYEVLSELGRSNARILKARHLATGELVAIKHFTLHTDADTLRRFQQEARIMMSIAHPNIVKIREVRLDAERPYLVMELVEGGNLQHLITHQGQLDVPTTIRLGLQVAAAFGAIHPQGIIHRDVKPENILYRPLPSGELHFLLTDFGVARLHEQSHTLTGQSLMTYEYASPEQFDNPRQVGVATDYYSLGVVLYECLTGKVPFALSDTAGIATFMNQVLHETPPALTRAGALHLPAPLITLLEDLLKKQPPERLRDPDELTWRLKQAELDYLQSSRPPASRRDDSPPLSAAETVTKGPVPVETPVVTQPRRPSRRLGPLALGAGLIFVALMLFGLYTLRKESPTSAPVVTGAPLFSPDTTTEQTPQPDPETLRQAQAAEAVRQQQEQREAAQKLSVAIRTYRVGLLGGIKNIQIIVTNPTKLTFTNVRVRVDYYKENGDFFKSERVTFDQVEPYTSPTQSAPDSKRGTRLTCSLTGYQFPEAPVPTDSSTTDPLN